MRFLIILFFGFAFHFSTANAAEGADRQWNKKIEKAGHFLQHRAQSPAQKSGLLTQRILDELDLFQQDNNHTLQPAFIWKGADYNSLVFDGTKLKQAINFSTKFSYHFTFSCLYPKHTFW